jgi:hypothetical protein
VSEGTDFHTPRSHRDNWPEKANEVHDAILVHDRAKGQEFTLAQWGAIASALRFASR